VIVIRLGLMESRLKRTAMSEPKIYSNKF
jgi:hypothetical protein